MKKCPQCHLLYADDMLLDYCLEDSSILESVADDTIEMEGFSDEVDLPPPDSSNPIENEQTSNKMFAQTASTLSNKRRKWITFLIIGLVFVIVGFWGLNYLVKRKAEKTRLENLARATPTPILPNTNSDSNKNKVDLSPALVGTWEVKVIKPSSAGTKIIKLNADGSLLWDASPDGKAYTFKGTWRYANNMLYLDYLGIKYDESITKWVENQSFETTNTDKTRKDYSQIPTKVYKDEDDEDYENVYPTLTINKVYRKLK